MSDVAEDGAGGIYGWRSRGSEAPGKQVGHACAALLVSDSFNALAFSALALVRAVSASLS